jgi:hypothetical protein
MNAINETEAEFMERRRRDRIRADLDAQDDPLIREVFGPRIPTVITQADYDRFGFAPGWALKKQAS